MYARQLAAVAGVALSAALYAEPAAALTLAECSAKFSEARKAGKLDGQSWTAFRRTRCGSAARDITEQQATAAAAVETSTPRLNLKQCGAKYQAAKAADTLNGMNWPAYRKAECGQSSTAKAGATEPETASANAGEAGIAAPPPGVTFPASLASEFSSETPARQRMRTCLEGYRQNKQAGTLNGLRWVQEGGGYYSLCNSRLKAAS